MSERQIRSQTFPAPARAASANKNASGRVNELTTRRARARSSFGRGAGRVVTAWTSEAPEPIGRVTSRSRVVLIRGARSQAA